MPAIERSFRKVYSICSAHSARIPVMLCRQCLGEILLYTNLGWHEMVRYFSLDASLSAAKKAISRQDQADYH